MLEPSGTVLAFLRAVGSHWTTLMSGGIITVALGLFERLSGKNVPLWLYIAVLIFFAFLACFLAWRDSQKEQVSLVGNKRRKEILAERLRDLLREAGEVDSRSDDSSRGAYNMNYLLRYSGQHTRSLRFLETHYDNATVERYKKEGNSVLEELLAESLEDDDPTKPKITGEIEEVIIEKGMVKENAGLDYFINLRFWLRNKGARTNFHAFKLSVEIGETNRDADKLPLAGFCLYRPEPRATNGPYTTEIEVQTKLSDYDAETPLDRDITRPGWLRFVLRNVRWNLQDATAHRLTRLNLTVTDGSGGTWTLSSEPPWKETDRELRIEPCPVRFEQLGLGGSRSYFGPRYR
jgi:hypothetical protein